jgi:prevent-host-death family protein
MTTSISSPARNHFGVLIDAARIAPVAVTKYDKPFVVVMAVEEYGRLKDQALASRQTGGAVPSSKGAKRIGRI